MSKFESCPKLVFEKCVWYEDSQCEGCPIYTAYHIGRADALKETLGKMRGEQNDLE